MASIESEVLAALFILYGFECLHWLRMDEEAFTHSSTGWIRHCATPQSFTLLRRNPLLVDPFLIRPGFVRRKLDTAAPANTTTFALQRVSVRMNALWWIEMQSRLQAIILLLYIPAVLLTHRLSQLWPVLLTVLLSNHVLLMVSLFFVLYRYKRTSIFTTAAPMLLNPLGATRIMETISQILFDREIAGHRKSKRPHGGQRTA
jgi:hypothetical protein